MNSRSKKFFRATILHQICMSFLVNMVQFTVRLQYIDDDVPTCRVWEM